MRRLDGPSNNPTGAVNHFPPEALPLTPRPLAGQLRRAG